MLCPKVAESRLSRVLVSFPFARQRQLTALAADIGVRILSGHQFESVHNWCRAAYWTVDRKCSFQRRSAQIVPRISLIKPAADSFRVGRQPIATSSKGWYHINGYDDTSM